MQTVKKGYGHGDILLQPATIPAAAVTTPQRVLAHGETGHAHVLDPTSDVEVYEHEGTLFLRVGAGGGTISHEEHGRGTIAPGEYKVGRQQEYDHFQEESRQVRD